jgi:Uncharacterized protein conserved in bacteria (DUF2188)
MAPSHYLVIWRGGAWAVRGANRTFGRFSDRIHAIDAAIDFAETDGKAGRSAKVLLQEDGKLRTVWTHGRDSYPSTPGNPANSRAKGTYRLP